MTGLYRTRLEDYAGRYRDFFAFRREDGILEARFHTNGGPLKWGLEVHRGIIPAMSDINDDPDNECLILTGTGDSFLAEFERESWDRHGFNDPFNSYHGYEIFYKDQTREPFALLNLQIPVVAAVNGPSIVHAELALLNDIVICSENTYFYEGHWDGLGIVPGDGVHTVSRAAWAQSRPILPTDRPEDHGRGGARSGSGRRGTAARQAPRARLGNRTQGVHVKEQDPASPNSVAPDSTVARTVYERALLRHGTRILSVFRLLADVQGEGLRHRQADQEGA
jgi:hypothetical protein